MILSTLTYNDLIIHICFSRAMLFMCRAVILLSSGALPDLFYFVYYNLMFQILTEDAIYENDLFLMYVRVSQTYCYSNRYKLERF